ncbi:MAG TPA: AI-2E family transporter [Chloroflexia bacterium]|nr:AI-2E family transporter [Chloroflexia bacterium]
MLSAPTNRRLHTLLTLLILSALVFLGSVAWAFLAPFFGIGLLFFLGWLVAYLLRPAQQRLTRRGLPSGLAVLVTYLAGPGLIVMAGYLLLPTLSRQIAQLRFQLDTYAGRLSGLLDAAQGMLTTLGVSASDIQELEARVREQAAALSGGLLQNALGTLQGLGQQLFALTLILVFSISFLTDGDALGAKTLAALPERWQGAARLIGASVATSFGSFVRGQLLFALIYALLNAALMFAFGLPYLLVAALAAGLLIIVPLVGNYLAFVPPLLITVAERPASALLMLIVLAAMQGLYLNLVGPRIMAHAVGLHPLVTAAAILVFGQWGGFWGAFFGIPIAATISRLAPPALRLLQSYLVGEDPAPPASPTPPARPAVPPDPGTPARRRDMVDEGDRLRRQRSWQHRRQSRPIAG